MDWLSKNQAEINCRKEVVMFVSKEANKVEIQRRTRKSPLRVVKASKLVKGLRKALPIYVLKLNKPNQEEKQSKPE